MFVGATGLLMVLAWAAGVHFAVGESAAGLFGLMAVVAALAHLEQVFGWVSRKGMRATSE